MLVGVGTASADVEAIELMALALEAAVADSRRPAAQAGRRPDRRAAGKLVLPRPGPTGGRRVGATRARTHLTELGIPQQVLINQALSAIGAGASEVAVVVGGEARRWARGGRTLARPPQPPGARPDVIHRRPGPLLEPVEQAHRLWDPVQQYAMIDNALRHAEGKSLAAHRGRDRRSVGPVQPGRHHL